MPGDSAGRKLIGKVVRACRGKKANRKTAMEKAEDDDEEGRKAEKDGGDAAATAPGPGEKEEEDVKPASETGGGVCEALLLILASPGLRFLFCDHVLMRLDPLSFARAEMACRTWRDLFLEEGLWMRRLLLRAAPQGSYYRHLVQDRCPGKQNPASCNCTSLTGYYFFFPWCRVPGGPIRRPRPCGILQDLPPPLLAPGGRRAGPGVDAEEEGTGPGTGTGTGTGTGEPQGLQGGQGKERQSGQGPEGGRFHLCSGHGQRRLPGPEEAGVDGRVSPL